MDVEVEDGETWRRGDGETEIGESWRGEMGSG